MKEKREEQGGGGNKNNPSSSLCSLSSSFSSLLLPHFPLIPALYIHIPFCKKKCNYCDFVSFAGKEELIDGYVEALVKEIKTPSVLTLFGLLPLVKGEKKRGGLKTVYFGGGTPILLEPRHFNKIISTLISHSSLVISHSEISIEANPGTADKSKLKELRQLGINRLSIGAQTFNDNHLKTLGRIHNSKQIHQTVEDARSVGFENINLDLIFALPNQTPDEWKKDLETALALRPNHLSTYNLQIEEGTPLYEIISKSQPPISHLQIPSEDLEAEMYEYTIKTLTAEGYHHYEISNFAQPGYECQHNLNYWKNGNYIGVGAGAHSHVNGQRWSNPDSVEEYIAGRDALRATPDDSHFATSRRETLFLGLRLIEGLPVEQFAGFEPEVAELLQDGLLTRENNHYRLSKRGLFLANLVFEKFV